MEYADEIAWHRFGKRYSYRKLYVEDEGTMSLID